MNVSADIDIDIDADEIIYEGEEKIRAIIRDELHNLGGTGYIRDALLDIPILEILTQQQQHHAQRAEATAAVNADLNDRLRRARQHLAESGTTPDEWEMIVTTDTIQPAGATRTSPNGPAPDRF